jgi:hypothetical protein
MKRASGREANLPRQPHHLARASASQPAPWEDSSNRPLAACPARFIARGRLVAPDIILPINIPGARATGRGSCIFSRRGFSALSYRSLRESHGLFIVRSSNNSSASIGRRSASEKLDDIRPKNWTTADRKPTSENFLSGLSAFIERHIRKTFTDQVFPSSLLSFGVTAAMHTLLRGLSPILH